MIRSTCDVCFSQMFMCYSKRTVRNVQTAVNSALSRKTWLTQLPNRNIHTHTHMSPTTWHTCCVPVCWVCWRWRGLWVNSHMAFLLECNLSKSVFIQTYCFTPDSVTDLWWIKSCSVCSELIGDNQNMFERNAGLWLIFCRTSEMTAAPSK